MKYCWRWILTTLFASMVGLMGTHTAVAVEHDFEQIKKNYYDTHPGKGSHGKFWEPIPIQKYWNPKDFYTSPKTVQGEFTQADCVRCHESITPGAFHAWKKSVHSDLNAIRQLPESDVRAYKKPKLVEVENNLRKLGLLEKTNLWRKLAVLIAMAV